MSISAVLTMRFLKKVLKRWPFNIDIDVNDAECGFAKFDTAYLIVSASLLTAFEYANLSNTGSVEWWIQGLISVLVDWVFAVTILAYVDSLFSSLVEAGMKLAEMNFHMGTRMFMEAHRASGGAVVPNIKPVPVGSAVFGVCSFLLLCIAIG